MLQYEWPQFLIQTGCLHRQSSFIQNIGSAGLHWRKPKILTIEVCIVSWTPRYIYILCFLKNFINPGFKDDFLVEIVQQGEDLLTV